MRLFEDFYLYPWMSMQENNANTIFIDGAVPTLIDPGHAHLFDRVVRAMAADGVDVGKTRLLVGTHAHPDHVEAFDHFENGVLRAIGKKEYEYFRAQGRDTFLMSGSRAREKSFKILLKEGTFELGGKRFQILETPGHSPGSFCLYWPDRKVLISGDTVFYLGVGRTDLAGGNLNDLVASVKKLAKLDVEYIIPGHGEMVEGKRTAKRNFQVLQEELLS